MNHSPPVADQSQFGLQSQRRLAQKKMIQPYPNPGTNQKNGVSLSVSNMQLAVFLEIQLIMVKKGIL